MRSGTKRIDSDQEKMNGEPVFCRRVFYEF